MPRLNETEFLATMDPHPVRVEQDDAPPFDFWDYFDAIPGQDFDGHDFSAGAVTNAWTMPSTDHQHVLIRCETANVFLVLVLDLRQRQVHGHHLLDIRKLYGLT
jgi:UDP-N-acetylmuramyl pentapeptide synthase